MLDVWSYHMGLWSLFRKKSSRKECKDYLNPDVKCLSKLVKVMFAAERYGAEIVEPLFTKIIEAALHQGNLSLSYD